jgi:oligopeptide transport system permease protein
MLKYVIKRLLAGVLTMVVLITVAFFMMHAMPGGPFSPSEEKNVPPDVLKRIAASYGLDQPVWQQYLTYWKNLLNGDLGVSYKTVGTVREKIEGHFPYSAQVGGLAVLFSLLIGIPMGLIAALHRGKAADMATLALATVGISVPVFVLSLLMSYLFSVKLKWLPTYGLDSWACYILPVVCLSMNPIAYIARQTR